jgi:hypothetical protein
LIKYFKPWQHITIDSYYDEQLFKAMQDELLNYVKTTKQLVNINYINDLSDFYATLTCINSKPVTQELLNHFQEYREYESLVPRYQVIICIGETNYPIHDEISSKILSAVTYVWSNNGTGTLLYDTDKTLIKEVEWEPNRMMAFCGQNNVTWHSYYSKPKSIRITLNTFLEKT